jgi:hypothetical protein
VSFGSPSSAELGDLRLGLRVRFFGDDDDVFQAAAGFSLFLPTGQSPFRCCLEHVDGNDPRTRCIDD